MGRFIIDLIGELVEISGNSTVDTIIFTIIGLFSFAIAFAEFRNNALFLSDK